MSFGDGQEAFIGKPSFGLLLELRCCVCEEVLTWELRKIHSSQSSGIAQRLGCRGAGAGRSPVFHWRNAAGASTRYHSGKEPSDGDGGRSDTLFTFNQHETTTRVGSPKVQVYRGPMDRGCDRERHTGVARCVEGQGGPRPCRLNTPPTPCVKRHRYMAKGLRRSRARSPARG